MMRRSAGYHADEARRQLLKEWQNVPALELTANDYITCRVNSVDLKNRFRDIETDCRNRLHIWLLRIVGALTAPTSMALPCRWRSRPQHQKRTSHTDNADHKGGDRRATVFLCGVLPLALERRDRARCLADHIEHHVRLRQHGHMARRDLGRGGFHAFRSEALQIGMNCLVLGGEDIRTRLCLPRGTFDLLIE